MFPEALTGPFKLPLYIDYPATFIWALSGALVAARLRMDPTGVATIALVTAAGGGLLRDGIFLQVGPPVLIRTPVYIILIAIAALLVIAAGTAVLRIPFFDHIVGLIDAIGLGAYAIVGLQLSLSLGLSVPAAIFVGAVNAVGGGVLRDVLLGRTPELLQPGSPKTLAAVVGCVAYVALAHLMTAPEALAGLVAIVVVFATRMISLRYGLTTKPIAGFTPPSDE